MTPGDTTSATTLPRVLLAHDWLYARRGGEAVLDAMVRALDGRCEIVGLATMFDSGASITPAIDALARFPSLLNRLPQKARRWLLPAYPLATLDLSKTVENLHQKAPIDFVLSTSSAWIKNLRVPDGVGHVCYCHAPARYLWSRRREAGIGSPVAALGLRVFGPALRRLDRRGARRVDAMLANSSWIQGEIRRVYAMDSRVLHPPVRTDWFTPSDDPREDYWLCAGALEPYKRVDLAIEAARLAGAPLRIVGEGSAMARLRKQATGAQVEFLGRVDDDHLRDLYRRARLLLFPQIEDFGITSVEAQACGTPVVARGFGGALDTVIPGETGALFIEPTPEAIVEAVERLTSDPSACRRNAQRFSEQAFAKGLIEALRDFVALTAF